MYIMYIIYNSRFLCELKHRVHLSKSVYGISHFRFCLVFIKVINFSSTKSMGSLKHHNSFQNKNNRKASQSFAPRPLIFELQQEVWKFNDICMSWSSIKTDLEMNFFNLENRSFGYVTFPISNFKVNIWHYFT